MPYLDSDVPEGAGHGDCPQISKTSSRDTQFKVFERVWTGYHALKTALAGRMKLFEEVILQPEGRIVRAEGVFCLFC